MDAHSDFLKRYNAAQPFLRGWLLAWLRDIHVAEDVLQETSLILWERFGEYRRDASFEAWGLGIARNQALKALRRTKVSARLASPEVLEAVAATYERSASHLEQRRRVLADCVDRLSTKLGKVVHLYFGKSLPVAEIARRTGRSAAGIKVSLFRARQWLADCTRKAIGVEPS